LTITNPVEKSSTNRVRAILPPHNGSRINDGIAREHTHKESNEDDPKIMSMNARDQRQANMTKIDLWLIGLVARNKAIGPCYT